MKLLDHNNSSSLVIDNIKKVGNQIILVLLHFCMTKGLTQISGSRQTHILTPMIGSKRVKCYSLSINWNWRTFRFMLFSIKCIPGTFIKSAIIISLNYQVQSITVT